MTRPMTHAYAQLDLQVLESARTPEDLGAVMATGKLFKLNDAGTTVVVRVTDVQ